jgi:predicted amidohydrolase
MHDLIIRNGVIVDGTGAARYRGDVAVDGGIITEVGAVSGAARRTIDAEGALVTPGLRGHPHPLRRPGLLGRHAGAVVHQRGHLGGHGQLRRRLRAGALRTGTTG